MPQHQVIKTLVYSDVFDYPLTIEQIHKYLITSEEKSLNSIIRSIKNNKLAESKNNFYFLIGRERLVNLRIQKEKESNRKIELANKKIQLLKFIPGILLLGISGSLSMKNAGKNDDIDLFIISEKNKVWSTRLLTVLILKLLGVYRGKHDSFSANKICLNMIIDEAQIKFSKNRQDLYTAHEIVQLMPIFDRRNMYKIFINSNSWINKYLANFEPEATRDIGSNIFFKTIWNLLHFLQLEKIAMLIQVKYMRNSIQNETIMNGFLAFHPQDPRKKILEAYDMKLRSLHISTRGY